MKSGGLNHLKTKRLKRFLGKPLYQVVGILECLWHTTAEVADEGDIGRNYTNEEIADALEWDGDAEELIAALVDSGFLDRCDESRLVIHDWMEHAPEYVKQRVYRRRQRSRKNTPATVNEREIRTYDDFSRNTTDHVHEHHGQPRNTTDHVTSIPNPTQPNPTNPNLNTNTPLPPTGGEPSNLSPDCKMASEGSTKNTPEPPKSAAKTTIRVKSGSNYSDDFNRWFAAYPRRVAKGAAWKAWPSALAHFRARSKATTDEAAVEELINLTVIYALSPKCSVEPEFIPHPATWLTARRFEDDPKEWQRVSGGASVGGSRSRVVAAGTGQVTPGDEDPFARR